MGDGEKVMVSVPFEVAELVERVFLPTNPNRMRKAAPEVVDAARAFKAAVAEVRLAERERAAAAIERMKASEGKVWPVQGDGPPAGVNWRDWRIDPRSRPCLCSDEDARRAYATYRTMHSQGWDGVFGRGGFSRSEMDEYAPGWSPIEREVDGG